MQWCIFMWLCCLGMAISIVIIKKPWGGSLNTDLIWQWLPTSCSLPHLLSYWKVSRKLWKLHSHDSSLLQHCNCKPSAKNPDLNRVTAETLWWLELCRPIISAPCWALSQVWTVADMVVMQAPLLYASCFSKKILIIGQVCWISSIWEINDTFFFVSTILCSQSCLP